MYDLVDIQWFNIRDLNMNFKNAILITRTLKFIEDLINFE